MTAVQHKTLLQNLAGLSNHCFVVLVALLATFPDGMIIKAFASEMLTLFTIVADIYSGCGGPHGSPC